MKVKDALPMYYLRSPCVNIMINVQSTCRGALSWPVPGPWQCRAASSRWAGRKSQSWRAWQSRSGLAGHTSACATWSLGIWAPQEECLEVPPAGRDHCLSRWTWGGVVARPARRTLGGVVVQRLPSSHGDGSQVPVCLGLPPWKAWQSEHAFTVPRPWMMPARFHFNRRQNQ